MKKRKPSEHFQHALDDTLDDFEHELARLTEYLQNETAAA